VTARLAESRMYAHLWGTPETRAVFDEQGRVQSWLEILVALARAQAELGIVPADAAEAIARHARVERLDLDLVAEQTRRSGHSTLGLIRGLRAILPQHAREHVYVGATVQDLTDTWTALAMRRVGAVVWRDLRALEDGLLTLAETHRGTLMTGRTHGQAGAAITFGWKAASWADEVRRHLQRWREGAPRWLVGQLGGGVGTLAFFGDQALALRRRFCAHLDLADPGISWLSARDRVAEFATTLTLVAGTLARIGNEVYALSRTEVGELAERLGADAVSSITMPHKRNPERAEHLVTLYRLVGAQAQVLLDGAVHEHERDGRGWKAEWIAFPEVCLLSGAALAAARELIDGLEVSVPAMAAHLRTQRESLASERLLALLAPRVGKHAAQELLQGVLAGAQRDGRRIGDVLPHDPALRDHLAREEIAAALAADPDAGAATAMVDLVIDRARTARAAEGDRWPP
jgi:adenylosuccinate lyase